MANGEVAAVGDQVAVERIVIGAPSLVRRPGALMYIVPVSSGGSWPSSLWFEVTPGAHRTGHAAVSDLADAATVALLVPAMRAGRDVVIEGPVTAELLHGLRHGVQQMLHAVIPGLREVQVTASGPLPAKAPARGVATGFSAGIDSWTTLDDHLLSDDVPSTYRVTDLLYANITYGAADPMRDSFRVRLAHAVPFAERLDLPLSQIDSNVGDFYRGLDIVQTHTMRHASIAFLLQQGVGRWLYSAAFSYPDVRISKGDTAGRYDPILLPILSTPSLDLRSVGGEYTRAEKTLRIARLPEARESLDVCVETPPEGGNCSVCWKCLRTELTLEIGGVLEEFSSVFDLNRYRQARGRYVRTVLASDDPLLKEIRDLAEERGYHFPRGASLMGAATRTVPSRVRWAARHPRLAARRAAEIVRTELGRL